MNSTVAARPASATREYIDVWLQRVSDGIERLGTGRITAESQSEEGRSPASQAFDGPGLWIRVFGGKAGEHAFLIPDADAGRLSQLLLKETSDEDAGLSPAAIDAISQFFRQIATEIPARDWLGFSCELDTSTTKSIPWEAAWRQDFRFVTEQGPLLNIRAAVSLDFASAVDRSRAAAKTEPDIGEAIPRGKASAAGRDGNLDLLMDIELEVTLRFGQREMLLGEVLGLAPGSVLELDQQVQDPVELLVGGRVVAWGEVVTVEGNYGLRITGLASREERLQSIRK